MDLALMDLLGGHSPTAAPVRRDAVGRLRDLWAGGLPLERAAAAAGVTVADAERRLAELGYRLPEAKQFDAELLRRLYVDDGLSAAEVAGRLGLTERQVRSRLARAGVRRPPSTRAATMAEKARSLYEAGQSIRAVAAELRIDQREVWRHLDRAGVARRPRGTPRVVLSKRQLERLYVRDELSLAEVARLFEVGPDVVARNLDRHGIPRLRPPLDRATLARLYVDEQLGIRATAGRLGVSETKVRTDLSHHGIPIRQPGRPRRRRDPHGVVDRAAPD